MDDKEGLELIRRFADEEYDSENFLFLDALEVQLD